MNANRIYFAIFSFVLSAITFAQGVNKPVTADNLGRQYEVRSGTANKRFTANDYINRQANMREQERQLREQQEWLNKKRNDEKDNEVLESFDHYKTRVMPK